MFGKRQIKAKLLTVWIALTLVLQCAVPAAFAGEITDPGEIVNAVQEESVEQKAEAAPAAEELVEAAPAAEAAPEESAPVAEAESVPAAETETEAAETASAEKAVTAETEAAPAEEAVTAEAEAVPAEETVAAEALAQPAEETVAAEAEAVPAEEAVTAETEAEPAGEEAAFEENTGLAAASSEAKDFANKAVYYYRSKDDNLDIPDTYIYDDDLLKGNSLDYKPELATMSLALVNASISATRGVYGDDGENSKSRNLRAYLEDNGFTDFKANEDYSLEPTLDTAAVACAHKKITDNGKEYTLLVIAPRSAGYKAEWGRNFTLGESGDHLGFTMAKDKVLDFARQYIKDTGLKGDIKVWIAGGSRGAGIVNLVGAEILKDSAAALGDAVTLTPENLYCYTFGTPHTADVNSEEYKNNASTYAYIHNHSEKNDVVGTFPPESMEFDRYGTTTGYADEEKKDEMLAYLKAISEVVYYKFISGGDPDSFKALDLDLQEMLKKNLSFKPASEDYYLYGMTQEEYLKLLESAMKEAFKDRTFYTEGGYQSALEHFFGYVYGKSGDLGPLFKGVMGSKYAIPAAASMFIYTTLDRRLITYGDKDETIADLKQSIADMDAAIKELEDSGLPLEKDLMDQYAEAREKILKLEASSLIDQVLVELCHDLAGKFYSKAMKAGLENVSGLDEETKSALTSKEDSLAMARTLGYILLADSEQDPKHVMKLARQQLSHLATLIGNTKRFMTPHYNEVILAWLRTNDPNYKDFTKANNAQSTGYRRVFVEQPEGVDVTGKIRNSAGEVVAEFKNGELLTVSNAWIGMTTADGGNWIRLPIDDTYKIDFSTSGDAALNIKVSEYSVEQAKEVRVATSDSKYNWKNLTIRPNDSATLVVSAIDGQDGTYTLNSGSAYYLDLLKRFFITYDLNGGTLDGSGDSVTRILDDGSVLTLPVPVREGYRFAYWKGSRYNGGDQYQVTGDHTFTAVWEKIEEEEKEEEKEDTPKKKAEESDDSEEEQQSASQSSEKKESTPAVVRRVEAVQTADTNPLVFWYMLFILSLIAASGAAVYRRK